MKPCVAAVVGLLLLAPVEAFSFATGKDVTFVSVELLDSTGTADSCDDDGVLDTGETARVHVTLRNNGTERLAKTSMTLSSEDPDVSFPKGEKVLFPASDPGKNTSAELTMRLSGPAKPRDITLRIDYRDDEQQVPGDKTHTAVYRVNTDELPGTSTHETVESPHHPWTLAASTKNLSPWTRQIDPTDTNWFFRGPNNAVIGELTLVSPPLQVSETEAFRFTFQHRYSFERLDSNVSYDGAVIELSPDGGKTWVNIGTSVDPTYNSTIYASGDNPLKGWKAYGGQSPGYPAFAPATANLATNYAGKTVLLRFRIGTDSEQGDTGWDLDDLQFEGLVNTPFSSSGPHRGLCLNRVPVANAGPDQTVNERRLVTLSGSGTDPEGRPLTYEWKQTKGPTVSLSDASAPNPTFVSPKVTADTDFQFELRVRDEVNTSLPDSVNVRVRDLPQGNHAPTVTAKLELSVFELDTVTLEASGTDADGDPLTYQWTQVGRPPVTLDGATTEKATFVAPEVTETLKLTFQIVASDGEQSSAPVTVTVTVNNREHAPVAAVEPVDAVEEGSLVTLKGSATDEDGVTRFAYTWKQVSGPSVSLSDRDTASPSFTAPNVDKETKLIFQLVVSDGKLDSKPVRVTVVVQDTSLEAQAGADQRVREGSGVTLNGSDSKGTGLDYTWTQVDGPPVNLILAGSKAMFNTPDVDEETALTFQLQVTDGRGRSSEDTVTVRVTDQLPSAPDSGCGCAGGQDGGVPMAVLLLLSALGFRFPKKS
ncbi:PKD domain containing protein [Cystobacter fuscus DSM 2262]|uniref:PKD domain containing protein n=1 Tax=Cystobacter fuscus (strain ATCC 25194 / DSM 2262 / NBRC 100088 / M29) TaxID=1242864 RepID=S9PCU0_CYSF2|nr:PKD domain-containing protein [Cystobacter fuscus]EPX62190.1 PKD domain containing protein [Cystobacter fuscus DSM 2262]